MQRIADWLEKEARTRVRASCGFPSAKTLRTELRLQKYLTRVGFDASIQGLQQRLARFELGVSVRHHVELLELLRDRLGGFHQLPRRHDPVQEAGVHGGLWVEYFRVDH